MRKITLLFVLALALVLVLPGLIGQLARARHEALVAALAANFEGGRLTASVYQDGWFTSRAIHRIDFEGPAYLELERDLRDTARGDVAPALVVDTRLAHGPWPGAVGRPALMSARSSLTLSGSDGKSVEIPGDVYTRVGFAGTGSARFRSPGLAGTDGRFRWDGADVTVEFGRGARSLRSEGTVGRLVLSGDDGELVLGEVAVTGSSRRHELGFWTGASDLRVERVEIVAADGSVLTASGLRLEGEIAAADALVSFRFRLGAAAVNGGAVVDAILEAEAYGERLDAREWGRYLALRRQPDADGAVDFARLARAGPRVGLSRLEIRSPDGELDAAAELELPENSRPRGPLTALGAAAGRGALTVSPGLLARIAQSGEPLRQTAELLLVLGYLREEDGRYAGEISLEDGVVTVNSMRLSLPF